MFGFSRKATKQSKCLASGNRRHFWFDHPNLNSRSVPSTGAEHPFQETSVWKQNCRHRAENLRQFLHCNIMGKLLYCTKEKTELNMICCYPKETEKELDVWKVTNKSYSQKLNRCSLTGQSNRWRLLLGPARLSLCTISLWDYDLSDLLVNDLPRAIAV